MVDQIRSELHAGHLRPARAEQRRRRRQAPAAPGPREATLIARGAERGRARRAASACSRRTEIPSARPGRVPGQDSGRRTVHARAGRPAARPEGARAWDRRQTGSGTTSYRGPCMPVNGRALAPVRRAASTCAGVLRLRSAPPRSAPSWRPRAAGRPPPSGPGPSALGGWVDDVPMPTSAGCPPRTSTRSGPACSMPRDRRQPSWSSTTRTGYRRTASSCCVAHLHDTPDCARLLLLSRQATRPSCPARSRSPAAHRPSAQPTSGSTTTRPRRWCWRIIPTIDAGDLERVVDQGDGWAAALVLAAHTLRPTPARDRGRSDARLALTAVTGSTLDYLHERGVRRLPARTPAGPAGDLSADRGDLRRRDRDVRAALGRRPARAGGRRRPGGHPDPTAPTTPARWRYHPLLVELLRRRTAPSGPHWPVVAQAHERAARHHRRHGDAAPRCCTTPA